jgi:S1-C subfamily serine protease
VGIGFAIPVDTVKRIVPDLIEKGQVSYPWLGINYYPLFPGLAQALKLKVDRGVLVIEVMPRSPADKAGIVGATQLVQLGNRKLPVGGDVIVAFNKTIISTAEEFSRLINKHKPGDNVLLKILRDNSFLEISVKLGERPFR